ncbi:hypothetical protein [Embleya hyalina]|uniref:Uncharacterized protein n=1 Tax=Embleya hyalina TaxID=516124 RepID=A0A401YEI8_9ACTN|nr:hypothetical protein [Embleya hyalina]GCD93023.1 hypothetical protein EHYA_00666 [Embleya hyalina]
MVVIAVLLAALAVVVVALTVVVSRRAACRTTTVEGLATERAHTVDARAVGGIWGVHGAGAETTAGLTAPESTRTFH